MVDDLISIIIPVYNTEKYLERCIKSVLNQSYPKFEVILVDDGSKDSSGLICDKYCGLDDRIKVLHKENEGLSAARNDALDIAEGKFVSFLDSDDWIHKDFIRILYSEMTFRNAEIVIADPIKVYNWQDDKDVKVKEVSQQSNVEAVSSLFSGLYEKYVITCGKLYDKKLFDSIRFPIGKLHEDEFTTYKLLYSSSSVVYIDCELYYYFQHANSITKNITTINDLHILNAYYERYVFFSDAEESMLASNSLHTLFMTYIRTLSFSEINVYQKKDLASMIYSLKSELINSNTNTVSSAFASLYFLSPRAAVKLYKFKDFIANRKLRCS